MSERREAEKAAERVRRFLYVRSGMSGVGPQIYGVGDPDDDGNQVDLTTEDLERLVRTVLGSDAEVVDPVRSERMRKINRRPVASGEDLLAGMRAELRNAPDTETE